MLLLNIIIDYNLQFHYYLNLIINYYKIKEEIIS